VIVADASAILEIVLKRERYSETFQMLFEGGEEVHAPHLLDLEVAHTLRRYWLAKELSAADCERAMGFYLELAIHRDEHWLMLDRIWALRGNLTAYDAAYLALAEHLEARLVTRDEGFRGVRTTARVELI
jgi:predicted nucleic acid-binding protein